MFDESVCRTRTTTTKKKIICVIAGFGCYFDSISSLLFTSYAYHVSLHFCLCKADTGHTFMVLLISTIVNNREAIKFRWKIFFFTSFIFDCLHFVRSMLPRHFRCISFTLQLVNRPWFISLSLATEFEAVIHYFNNLMNFHTLCSLYFVFNLMDTMVFFFFFFVCFGFLLFSLCWFIKSLLFRQSLRWVAHSVQ